MPKLITHQDYCRAKNEAGNKHLDKVLPLDTRLLFPFKYHTNFHLSVARSGANGSVKQKRISPLLCGICGDDLSESGNGSYYCANIVFISKNEFYSSCYDCARSIPYDYNNQTYGNPKPLEFPIRYNNSLPHELVWYGFLSGNKWLFGDLHTLTGSDYNKLTSGSDGGGTFSGSRGVYAQYKHGVLSVMDNNWKVILKLSKGDAVKCANEIIEANNSMRINLTPTNHYVQAKLF